MLSAVDKNGEEFRVNDLVEWGGNIYIVQDIQETDKGIFALIHYRRNKGATFWKPVEVLECMNL